MHVWAAVKKYHRRTRVGIEPTTSWLLDRRHTINDYCREFHKSHIAKIFTYLYTCINENRKKYRKNICMRNTWHIQYYKQNVLSFITAHPLVIHVCTKIQIFSELWYLKAPKDNFEQSFHYVIWIWHCCIIMTEMTFINWQGKATELFHLEHKELNKGVYTMWMKILRRILSLIILGNLSRFSSNLGGR